MIVPFARVQLVPWIGAVALLALPAAGQCIETTNISINGFHNPFLAGQPPGTKLGNDVVPDQAPHQVSAAMREGELVRFQSVGGQVTYTPLAVQQVGAKAPAGPEGDPNLITTRSAQYGISGLRMPTNALLGVFLGDSPNAGSAPSQLNFAQPAARDFALLQPQLHQVFFIGDGLREDGVTSQEFRVPAGATRLFLGTADPEAWFDNSGSLNMTMERERAQVYPYCIPKLSSKGCLPIMNYTGYPSLDGSSDFDVLCENVSPGVRGTFFYGRAAKGDPFQGGFLCTHVNIRRTPITQAPQTPSGAACSSYLLFDFNDWILSGNDPSLVPGEVIYAQWWMRDAGSPSSTGLSDALEIHLCQ